MKKIVFAAMMVATLVSNSGFAQTTTAPKKTGSSAQQAGSYSSNGGMAWGLGLGALVVVGTIVGLTAGTATANPNPTSH